MATVDLDVLIDDKDTEFTKVKSAIGYEAYEIGSHIEYWSATHGKWLLERPFGTP